jgi:hypothetical protein
MSDVDAPSFQARQELAKEQEQMERERRARAVRIEALLALVAPMIKAACRPRKDPPYPRFVRTGPRRWAPVYGER